MTIRLLWVSGETPDRHGAGGQRRQFLLAEALVRAGVDLTVVVPATDQDPTSVQGLAPTVVVHDPPRRRDVLRPSAFDRLVRSWRPDAVLVAHTGSLRLLPRTWRRRSPLLVTDLHNVDSSWERLLGDERAARRAARWERRALRRGPALACSDDERAALLHLVPGADVTVVRQGFDPGEWPPFEPSGAPAATIAFFGSLWYPVNREGVEWFLEQAWPAVRAARPDAEVRLYGAGAPPELHDPGRGVHLEGWVEDLAGAVRRADALVMPILAGPGSRVKFPEALASGVPVVATGVAAESFDAEGLYERADTPDAFAEACLRVLAQPAEARAMARAARDHACATLTWDHGAAAVIAVLRRMGL